jgi:cytochrome c oxidase subunit IV
MATIARQGISKYLTVYVLLLAITGLQFMIGYQNVQGAAMVVRMLTFGIIEAILIVLFMMNLSSEKRTFVKFFAYFMLFVLAAMNWIWTDSFRLLVFRLTGMGPS